MTIGSAGTATRIEPLDSARSERSIRVLVAGDDTFHRQVADALACPDIALVDKVATGDTLLKKLEREEFDCLVADQTVSGRSSLELRQAIEQRVPNPPAMVMLTAGSDPKAMLKAFRNGVSDYVSTDHAFNAELLQAVRRAVARHRRTQVMIDEIEHLSRLARYDRLTGVPNRYFLEDRLANLFASGRRHSGVFSAILIDLNNFRTINDIYGHAIGDRVLKSFARKLMQASRSSDAFGRFGGDEFLYLIDREATHSTVEQACARLAGELTFALELDSMSIALSASIGAALFPFDGADAESLLNAAKQAMYTAKAAGGGYFVTRSEQPVTIAIDAAEAVSAAGQEANSTPPAKPGGRAENRRAEHRERVLRRGRIVLGDGFSTIDCVIRDLSAHGARVTVQEGVSIPRTFSLMVLDTGDAFAAMRRWQRGDSIGLEFVIEEATRRDDQAA